MTTILVANSHKALMNKVQCLRDKNTYLANYIIRMNASRDSCCASPDDVQFSDNQPAEFSDESNAEFS